jgi:hypothetical protein
MNNDKDSKNNLEDEDKTDTHTRRNNLDALSPVTGIIVPV